MNATSEWASSDTSTGLLRRAIDNEADAWNRILHLYLPLIMHWLRRAGVSSQDVDDLAQEVFGAIAKDLQRFRKQRPGDSFRKWLWGITRNKTLNYYRTQKKQSPEVNQGSDIDRIPNEPPEESDMVEAERARILVFTRAMDLIQNEFESTTWKAFWRTAIDGRQGTEVAAELGMTVGAVYTAKSRVLKRIREEFAGLLEAQ